MTAVDTRRVARHRSLAFFANLRYWLCLALVGAPQLGAAAELSEAEVLFHTGKYAECAELAGNEIAARSWREPWRH